jgi:hypothetical protein
VLTFERSEAGGLGACPHEKKGAGVVMLCWPSGGHCRGGRPFCFPEKCENKEKQEFWGKEGKLEETGRHA